MLFAGTRQNGGPHRIHHRRQLSAVVVALLLTLAVTTAWAYQSLSREQTRQARIVKTVLEGWQLFMERDYTQAGKSFEREFRRRRGVPTPLQATITISARWRRSTPSAS